MRSAILVVRRAVALNKTIQEEAFRMPVWLDYSRNNLCPDEKNEAGTRRLSLRKEAIESGVLTPDSIYENQRARVLRNAGGKLRSPAK